MCLGIIFQSVLFTHVEIATSGWDEAVSQKVPCDVLATKPSPHVLLFCRAVAVR